MANRNTHITWRSIITFCYLSLCLGFPLGLVVLTVGPAAWMANYAQATNMSLALESTLGKVVIGIYIVVTLLIALWLTKVVVKTSSRKLKLSIYSLFTILLIAALFIFSFKPQVMVSSSTGVKEATVQGVGKVLFVLGPYPDRDHLEDLKADGYTAVISLLHEMVVPAEPVLIEEEKENAQQVGIKIIRIPMLPWISGNEDALQKIKDLAINGKGKYYVHCYLGRDRVNVFKTIVKAQAADAMETDPSLEKARSLDDLKNFERGPIVKISNGIYVIPYPTEEEMFGYLLNGTYKEIICILDPKDPTDKKRILDEKEVLDSYGVKFSNIPMASYSNENLQKLTDYIKKAHKPIVIHGYKVDETFVTKLRSMINKIE